MSSEAARPSWYTSARVQTLALWFLVALAAVEGFVAVVRKENDFVCHRVHGAAFLAGDYFGGGNDHYLPARVLFNVLLAAGPYRLTRAIVFGLSLLLLLVCRRLWEKMAAELVPARASVARAAAIFTILLMLPYLIRDLDECGLQIYLLFFLTLGGYALSRGWSARAGFWLASAATYKVTPLLCLPFLVWKRQWRAAGWMLGFVALWAVAPAWFCGWEKTIRAHEHWWHMTVHVKEARQAYPSLLEREDPKPQNLSLYAAIARYLETYPSDHPLYLTHRWFAQFGNLSREWAYQVLHGMLAALALCYAWKTRRAWVLPEEAGALAREWATICTLCALLSPLCWKQHLVLVMPCAYLVIRNALTSTSPKAWRLGLLAGVGAITFLCRHFVVGREFSIVLLSYKLDTLAMLVLAVWCLFLSRRPALYAAMTLFPPVPERCHVPLDVTTIISNDDHSLPALGRTF